MTASSDSEPRDSPDATGPGPNAADSEAVAEAIRQFFRAHRALRTYPVDNAISQQVLAVAGEALGGVLPLTLRLFVDRLEWQQTLVLDDRGETPPLVGGLFKDGIRRIVFETGLAGDELQRLLLVLVKPVDPDDLTEDYVTRLWEADLPSIRISAIDPYLAPEIEGDVLEETQEPPADREPNKEAANVPLPPNDAFRIRPEDAERVAADIQQAASVTRWQDFIEASFDAVATPQGEQRLDRVAQILETYFALLVREGQLAEATTIVERLKGAWPETDSVPGGALERMADADRLAPLHEALEMRTGSPEEVQSLLVHFGPAAVDAVCQFLDQSKSPALRRLYAQTLGQIGDPAVPEVVARFRRSSEGERAAYTVALGAMRGDEVVSTLLEAIEDPDQAVRREGVRALAAQTDERARDALLRTALDDDVERITRIIALGGLRSKGQQLDYQSLLQRIQSRRYRSLTDEEKTLLFLAFGATGKDDAVGVLRDILTPSWFPWRQRRDDWTRAASALVRLGTPKAVQALEEFSRNRNSDLAAVCATELRSVRKNTP